MIVADYKATARRGDVSEANLYPGYKRQLEVYQFLLAQQGLAVESRCWFVYANGDPTIGPFVFSRFEHGRLTPFAFVQEQG